MSHVAPGVCIFCDTMPDEWEAFYLLRELSHGQERVDPDICNVYNELVESIGTIIRFKRANVELAKLFLTKLI